MSSFIQKECFLYICTAWLHYAKKIDDFGYKQATQIRIHITFQSSQNADDDHIPSRTSKFDLNFWETLREEPF